MINGIEVRLCNIFNRYSIKETDIKVNFSDVEDYCTTVNDVVLFGIHSKANGSYNDLMNVNKFSQFN
jgi:hypothetical protein